MNIKCTIAKVVCETQKHRFDIGMFFFIAVYFILGILLDLTYKKEIDCCLLCGLLEVIKNVAHSLNFQYEEVKNTFSDNFSLIITAIGILVSMSVSVFNRMEGDAYGLPREVIFPEKYLKILKHLRRWAYIAPAMMVAAIKWEQYIWGSMIIIYIYLLLIFTFSMLEISYDGKKTQKYVMAKLCDSVPDNPNEKTDMGIYLVCLESIRFNVEEEGNWQKTEDLYNNIVLKQMTGCKKYAICYYFYSRVFVEKDPLKGKVAIRVFDDYIRKTDEIMVRGNENEIFQRNIVLWGMLCSVCCYSKWDNIFEIVHIMKQYPIRSKRIVEKRGKTIPQNRLDIQMGLLLINIEYIFRIGKTCSMILEDLPILWEHGQRIFEEENVGLLDNCMELYKKWINSEDLSMDVGVRYLYQDFKDRTCKSLVRSLTEGAV